MSLRIISRLSLPPSCIGFLSSTDAVPVKRNGAPKTSDKMEQTERVTGMTIFDNAKILETFNLRGYPKKS